MKKLLMTATLAFLIGGLALTINGIKTASEGKLDGVNSAFAGFLLTHAAVLPLKLAEITGY